MDEKLFNGHFSCLVLWFVVCERQISMLYHVLRKEMKRKIIKIAMKTKIADEFSKNKFYCFVDMHLKHETFNYNFSRVSFNKFSTTTNSTYPYLSFHCDTEKRDKVHDENWPKDRNIKYVKEGAYYSDGRGLCYGIPELEFG
jgi:hypothetical protein